MWLNKIEIHVLKSICADFLQDYKTVPIGHGNPYYKCAECGQSEPAISYEGHYSHCRYRKRQRYALILKDIIDKCSKGV